MTEIEIQIQMEMNSKQTARGMSGAEGRGQRADELLLYKFAN